MGKNHAVRSFTCAACKKHVEVPEYVEWAWEYRSRSVCSYTCMRALETGRVKQDVKDKAKFGFKERHVTGQRMIDGRMVNLYTWRGEQRPIREWSKITGISEHVLHNRLYYWEDMDRIMTAPLRGEKRK